MLSYYEIKNTKDGQYYWNLKAGNHEIFLTSEIYTTRAAAENGIDAVRNNCENENRYETRESSSGKPYFILKAGNGHEIGRSDLYASTSALNNGIQSVMHNGITENLKDKTNG